MKTALTKIKSTLSKALAIAPILFGGMTGSLLVEQNAVAAADNTIRIAGWDVYGDPEAQNKTIGYKSFEKQFKAKIEFTPLSNLDDIVKAAESKEGYDVFIMSNEGIRMLHERDLVSDLNLNEIPNYNDLHPSLRFSKWSVFDNKPYAVPWAWGPTGLLYDQDAVTDPDSWNIMWKPEFKGKVSLWDDVSIIWTAALALGYENVYTLDSDQLEKVKQKLFELNDQVHSYYAGNDEELSLIREKKVVILNSWFDPSIRLKKEGLNFKMMIPKEGAVGMFDSYLISKSTKKTSLINQYINHQISPEIQKEMALTTGLAPATIETLAFLKPEEIKALHLNEPDYFNRMLLWDHMPQIELYEKVLEEVKEDMQKKKSE